MSRVLLRGNPVNRSHPLARGIKNCWLANGSGKTLFDVVGGNHGELSTRFTHNQYEPRYLPAIKDDNSGNAVITPTNTWGGTVYSAGFVFMRVGASMDGALWGWGGAGTDCVIRTRSTSDNNFLIRPSDGGSFSLGDFAGSRGRHRWQSMLVSYSSGSLTRACLNGVANALTTTSGSATFGNMYNVPGLSTAFSGIIQSAWFWDRAMSDSEAAEWCDEADLGFPTLLNWLNDDDIIFSDSAGGIIPRIVHHLRQQGVA